MTTAKSPAGKCPKCNGQILFLDGTRKCLQCSYAFRGFQKIGEFVSVNLPEITADLKIMPVAKVAEKWNLGRTTLHAIRHNTYKYANKVETTYPRLKDRIPTMPDYNPAWPAESRRAWLEDIPVYLEILGRLQ